MLKYVKINLIKVKVEIIYYKFVFKQKFVQRFRMKARENYSMCVIFWYKEEIISIYFI